MHQDDLNVYIVWVGPCDQLTFSTATFKSIQEKLAYCRGVSDANGWDHAVFFLNQQDAKKYIEENVKGQK